MTHAGAVVLAGRVLDSAGRPIVGAQVRIRSQTRGSEGQLLRLDPVVAEGEDTLRSDAEGRFRTPHAVPSGVEYEATAVHRGMRPGQTAWMKAGGGATVEFPVITLRRLRSVAGAVRDRAGRPIEGAIVSQSGDGPIRTRAVSDSQGRFDLKGLIEGKAILFARKDEYRFQGQPIDTEAGPAELVISRSDESPVALETLESVLPRDDEVALAARLLAPYVDQVMAKGTDQQKVQTLRTLAPIDPARTLELLEAKGAGKPQVAIDMLRDIVATALAGTSPDEAVSVAESIQDPAERGVVPDRADRPAPRLGGARKSELLAQRSYRPKASSSRARRSA